MLISTIDIDKAIDNAAERREHRADFARVLSHRHDYIEALSKDLQEESWEKRIQYRVGDVTNTNGKHRVTYQPDCHTLILQHLCMILLQPYYRIKDNGAALNCKKGCGLTSKQRQHSVVHRLKHVFYDRRDLNYVLRLDQRKCYEHVSAKVVRKALKTANVPRWLSDMAITLGFVESGKVFPVGTPLSPLLHHFAMLSTDKLIRQLSPTSVRYADDVILFFEDKAQAQAAKWRIKNLWWYELSMRAKRGEAIVQSIDLPIDFCGTVYHRNADKTLQEHNKGYCNTRRSTVDRAMVCTRRNYPSYFGLMITADNYNLLNHLENTLDLQRLTQNIRIDRNLDAPNISVKELVEKEIVFAVHDYEIRSDANGKPNWIKCKISYPNPEKPGRRLVKEYHGDYQGIINYHKELESVFANREFLPLTNAVLDNSCGYIYRGSTNMQTEMEDSEVYCG